MVLEFLPDKCKFNYYPFGMVMPNRSWEAGSAEGYRFGFNGKEGDSEIKGENNSLDFGARIYDPRLGKFLSLDPYQIKFPWITHYAFASNSPLLYIDAEGMVIQFADNAQKETATKTYQDIYDHADDETKAKLKVLENSDVVYLIDFNADLSEKKIGSEDSKVSRVGSIGINFTESSFDSKDPSLVVDISIDLNANEYEQIAALADELETGYRFETNEFSFVTLPQNETGTYGYGMDDEAASQDASVKALTSLMWPLNEAEGDWESRSTDEAFFKKYDYQFLSENGVKGDAGLSNEELQTGLDNMTGASSIILRKKDGDSVKTEIIRKQNK